MGQRRVQSLLRLRVGRSASQRDGCVGRRKVVQLALRVRRRCASIIRDDAAIILFDDSFWLLRKSVRDVAKALVYKHTSYVQYVCTYVRAVSPVIDKKLSHARTRTHKTTYLKKLIYE